jgi:hypothetical protein
MLCSPSDTASMMTERKPAALEAQPSAIVTTHYRYKR